MSKLKNSSVDEAGNLHVKFDSKTLARIQKAAAVDGKKDGGVWLNDVVESCITAALGEDEP